VKVREARQAALPAPPEELLWFTQSWRPAGRGPGMDAYPDRAAWLAARRDWETRHGMTIAEWSAATWAELHRRAGSLDEFNEALELTMYEADDWQDPRDLRDLPEPTPEQQLAAVAAMRAKMREV
jgi:hypothetical protein